MSKRPKFEKQDYTAGSTVIWEDESGIVLGKVVPNYKLPGDICIDWETGQKSSYDEDFLFEHRVRVAGTDAQQATVLKEDK